jgi:transcriptional regulator with XRE-family HTH domain
MKIGQRLRDLRTLKKLTQSDIEKRTGLKRSYTSRVENDLTTPSIDTFEKYAQALEIPLYWLFYDGVEPATNPIQPSGKAEPYFSTSGRERSEMKAFATALSKMKGIPFQKLLYVSTGRRPMVPRRF